MAEETTKVVRTVKMKDGTEQVFRDRQNIKTSFDVETNAIVFMIFSGETITWYPLELPFYAEVSNASEEVRKVVLFGLLSKIKSNIAPVKLYETVEVEVGKNEDGTPIKEQKTVNALYEAVVNNIKSIQEGKFSVRGSASDDDLELTIDQKAYAILVVKYSQFFPTKQGTLEWTLDNLDETAIILDIQAAWDAKTKVQRNTIKKDAYFGAEKGMLLRATITDDESLKTPVFE